MDDVRGEQILIGPKNCTEEIEEFVKVAGRHVVEKMKWYLSSQCANFSQLSTSVEPTITPAVHECNRKMADDGDFPPELAPLEFFDRVRRLRERVLELKTDIGELGSQNIDIEILQDPDWFTQEGFDPLCTARQRGMAWYYETFGIKGLAYMIVQIAAEEAREEHRIWRIANGKATQSEYAASSGTADEEALPGIDALGVGDTEEVDDQPVRDEAIRDTDEDEVDEHEGSCHPFAGRWTSSQKPRVRVGRFTSLRDDRVAVPTSTSKSSSPVSSAGKESLLELRGVHASWKLILKDWVHNDGLKLLYYLSQLHPKVIVALINGDLALKMQDPAFSSDVQAHLTPSDRQGTYAVFVSVQRTSNQSSVSNAGKGLTVRQIVQAYEDIMLYIDVENPASEPHARQVDEQFSGNKKLLETLDYKKERRYGSGKLHDEFVHHEEWLSYVEAHHSIWHERFENTDQDHLLDVHLDRCPVYVGLAKGVVQRSEDHSNHAGSITPVLGLLCAVLKLRYGELFPTTTSTWQILKTIHTSHIGFDEKLTTILCSAYPWDGGLSTAYAGINRGQPGKYNDRDYDALQQNIKDIELSGLQKVNLDESDVKIQTFEEQFRDALKYASEHKVVSAAVDSELARINELLR